MDAEGFETRLRDGTRVQVRPIRPEDRDQLQQGLHRLSPRSRYLRFHGPVAHLTDSQLRYLTEPDPERHRAFVAIDAGDPGRPGIGVARWVRLPHEPSVAEAAVTVADEQQGRGVGSLLLEVLAKSALENGIRAFRAYVLPDNQRMRELLAHLAVRPVLAEEGVLRFDVPLPVEPRTIPRAPVGRLLAVAAAPAGPEESAPPPQPASVPDERR